MTKKQLIAVVAAKTGMSRKTINKVLSILLDTIVEELKADGSVKITGFGTFEVDEHAAREGRNPASGETIVLESRKLPKFKPSRLLKAILNTKEPLEQLEEEDEVEGESDEIR